MATTKTKKNKEVKEVVDTKKEKSHKMILGARITEKSAIGAEKGVYTFNVPNEANKNEVKKAIKFLYNVSPLKVAITQIADKQVVRRGNISTKRGGKKAVVYLKRGDKITFA